MVDTEFTDAKTLCNLQTGPLASKTPSSRIRALESLGRRGTIRCLNTLLTMLAEDPSSAVRMTAAEHLGKVFGPGSERVEPDQKNRIEQALLGALCDGDAAVRRTSAQTLGLMRSGQAVPMLITLLEDRRASVQFRAAEALESIGDASAVGPVDNARKRSWNPLFRRAMSAIAQNLRDTG